MEHLVVLLARPVGVLEERPRVVEQADRECAAGRVVELRGDGWTAHDRVSFRDAGDVVEDALEAMGPGLDPGAVAVEAPLALGRVVDRENLADLVERHLQLAQPADDLGGLELLGPVAAVARERVDVGRPEQVELVVVPERADAQPGEPRELPDREEVIGHVGIVDPRVGRESSGCRPIQALSARGRSPGG